MALTPTPTPYRYLLIHAYLGSDEVYETPCTNLLRVAWALASNAAIGRIPKTIKLLPYVEDW